MSPELINDQGSANFGVFMKYKFVYMPMYGSDEGFMKELEFPNIDLAIMAARKFKASGRFLFCEVQDESGNTVISESKL